MFATQQYELLDFGNGEKLESFSSEITIRRPAPVSDDIEPRLEPNQWEDAIRYDREFGWNITPDDNSLDVEHRGIHFQISATPTGQVGIFPEQVQNWDWILSSKSKLEGLKAINLFGYTGGTTMALAKRGVHVTHVDSAASVVAWARSNAKASGLESAPIRWITEDAMRFVNREINRGNHYDIVVADPPSFGRGPKKEVWKIQRDLPELIRALDKLCNRQCKMGVLSCHTTDFTAADLAELTRSTFGLKRMIGQEIELSIPCASQPGRKLPSGNCFRFERS